MAVDSEKIRGAIKPQDGVSIAITLLGVAIAIFLGDSIIKLIGGSIALLGGMALYMTIRQRLNDQVQIQQSRKTTLPPPTFKTRVTQDPATNTKRIHFDDFQETFNPADEDSAELSSFTSSRPVPSGDGTPLITTRPPQVNVHISAERTSAAGTNGHATVPPAEFGDDGSFRVVGAQKIPMPVLAPSVQESSKNLDKENGQIKVPAPVPAPPIKKATPAVAPTQTSGPKITIASPQATPLAEAVVNIEESAPVLQPEVSGNRKQVDMILEDLVSDETEAYETGKSSEPRAEFVRLVGQLLNAVARSMPSRTIVFSWVNLQKGHMIPEAHLTRGKHEIRTGVRLPLGNDVISQIARSGIPEILTDISASAELDLVPYYGAEAGTRSIIGVPVFFRREVVGVLAADSSEEHVFDESSVATLAEYTRLIAGLIRGYTEKYDLQLTARTLEAFEGMHRAFTGSALKPKEIAEILVAKAGELFDHKYIAAVLYDGDSREWAIAAHHEDTSQASLAGLFPDMSASLVGHCACNAEEIYLEQTDREIRFTAEESFEDGGAFIALPLAGTTKCYGALVLEHQLPGAYIHRDVELLRDLVRYAAMAIEVYNVNNAIDSQSIMDEGTGVYNIDYLLGSLDRESRRARDFRKPLAFGLIEIDIPESLRVSGGSELEESIIAETGVVVMASLRPYDIIGRYGSRTFGVILVERNDQDAYLWAERLRKDIASHIIGAAARKFAVTVSIGICDLSDAPSSDSVITGATQALERARSGDGNAVILF